MGRQRGRMKMCVDPYQGDYTHLAAHGCLAGGWGSAAPKTTPCRQQNPITYIMLLSPSMISMAY